MRQLHLHIGLSFFGAGNLGDDLMLAGFLVAIAEALPRLRLTCCISAEPTSQQRRFPQIEWWADTPTHQRMLIGRCDAWLGLGGTPFQLTSGDWLLDCLYEALRLCGQLEKPMYFLGAGAESAQAVERGRAVIAGAGHIWSRDEQSARWLAEVGGNVSEAADLAHSWLRQRSAGVPQMGQTGYALNFESAHQYSPDIVESLIDEPGSHLWLMQETRRLPGSELDLYTGLSSATRKRAALRTPQYFSDSLDMMLWRWGMPAHLLTSRYHAALVGAWGGSAVTVIERSGKLTGLVKQLGLASLPDLRDVSAARAALASARPVARARLESLHIKARTACQQFLAAVGLGGLS